MQVTCTACRTTYDLSVTEDQLQRWRAGGLIQNVMPHLSADERELLISGTCGPCFDWMFKPSKEEVR